MQHKNSTSDFQFESLGPALNVIVLMFLIVFALALLGLVVVLAALPGRIAKARNHPQAESVNVCGWVGLPTEILWAIALVWAFWRYDARSTSVDCSHELPQLSRQLAGLEKSVSGLESTCKGSPS